MSRLSSLLVSASFLASIPFLVLGPTPVLAASASEQELAEWRRFDGWGKLAKNMLHHRPS